MIEHIKNIFRAVSDTAERPADRNRMMQLCEIAARELKFYDQKSRVLLAQLFDQAYCEGYLDAKTNRNPNYSKFRDLTSEVKNKVNLFWEAR